MRVKEIPVYLVLLFSVACTQNGYGASDCTAVIPSGGAYDVFRGWSSADLQLGIDDLVYDRDYSTHDQALNDGFNIGATIYDVPLTAGATFTQTQKDTWRHEYEQRNKLNRIENNRGSFEQFLLNTKAVGQIEDCIIRTESFGLQGRVDAIDACHFSFSVSYRGQKIGDDSAQVTGPLSITQNGGACEQWPTTSVGPSPTTIQCVRYGRGAVEIILPTTAGSARDIYAALQDPGPPPNPPVWTTQTNSQSSEFRADKNSSYTGAGLGEGSELRVTIQAPGNISNISYKCDGGACDWVYVCPDGGKCGQLTNEFDITGNTAIWHAWSNSGVNATLIFPYTYTTTSSVCSANCDYSARLAAWREVANWSCPSGSLHP